MAGVNTEVPTDSLHVLQITNHGIHEWHMTPGLPDTGGQNVYVNSMTEALIRLGHRVTIVNRGGYPHPVTGAPRIGTAHRHGNRARIVYLMDDVASFVRKEDMAPRIPVLSGRLAALLATDPADLVFSHYWDGALLGIRACERLADPPRHVWVPHSLGALKRRNVDPARWADLRIDERIALEREILGRVEGVVSTSETIRSSLREDYGIESRLSMPPGVDPTRYRPRTEEECPGMWDYLADRFGKPVDEVRGRPLVIEVSRTDTTKRKDVLLRSFAAARRRAPDALLAVTIDDTDWVLHSSLIGLIDELGLSGEVAVLGSVWEQLPCLYALSTVYCTPSVMEGFGMSAAEGAATGLPVIASDLVPFAAEYLLGTNPTRMPVSGTPGLLIGEGAVVAPSDSVEAFTEALVLVLTDRALAARLGTAAREAVVPRLTWDRLTTDLLAAIRSRPGPP